MKYKTIKNNMTSKKIFSVLRFIDIINSEINISESDTMYYKDAFDIFIKNHKIDDIFVIMKISSIKNEECDNIITFGKDIFYSNISLDEYISIFNIYDDFTQDYIDELIKNLKEYIKCEDMWYYGYNTTEKTYIELLITFETPQ
ncbi:MAG: hypothetical protein [Caudoviricetes sp.]|nr:MAG: hypothetical protein [Caudoviricetes sp.]